MNAGHHEIGLTEVQTALLDGLAHLILEHVRAADGGDVADSDRSPIFCIDGPRGSGKSTLMRELYRGLTREKDRRGSPVSEHVADLARVAHATPIMDCTTLPDSVSPGAAVLVALGENERLWARWPDPTKKNTMKCQLEALAGTHAEIDPSYRELCLEMASTPGDFAPAVTQGIKNRITLQRRLAIWTEAMRDHTGISGLIVLLDDFDLLFGSGVRGWIRALLDELHQQRIVFVITADFHRLEHLAWSREQQLDDLTGRAILNKLIPPQNRCTISPWENSSKLEFRPRWASSMAPTLGALLQPRLDGLATHEAAFKALLPTLPRGLKDLYQSLKERTITNPEVAEAAWLLSALAKCRAEPLLARRLDGEVPIDGWCNALSWGDLSLSVERWRETVRAAAATPDDGGRYPAMVAIAPPPWSPGHRPMLDRWIHDSEIEDPARHDQYRYDQLRDARDQDRAIWVELLLNVSMDDNLLPPADHRTVFLLEWPPAAKRLESTRFRVPFSREQLWDELSGTAVPFRGYLSWMDWREELSRDQTFMLDIGWVPFLAACRGARDVWPAGLLKRLYIGPDSILGDLGTTPSVKVLPGRVAAQVLFVDALHRCPWDAYSGPAFGWQLLTYIRLAQAFVRTAYVHALLTRFPNEVKREQFGEVQRLFLHQLERQDPVLLTAGTTDHQAKLDDVPPVDGETRVAKLLEDLDREDLRPHLMHRHDPIARAALCFLDTLPAMIGPNPE